jgi:hypothetical protein
MSKDKYNKTQKKKKALLSIKEKRAEKRLKQESKKIKV